MEHAVRSGVQTPQPGGPRRAELLPSHTGGGHGGAHAPWRIHGGWVLAAPPPPRQGRFGAAELPRQYFDHLRRGMGDANLPAGVGVGDNRCPRATPTWSFGDPESSHAKKSRRVGRLRTTCWFLRCKSCPSSALAEASRLQARLPAGRRNISMSGGLTKVASQCSEPGGMQHRSNRVEQKCSKLA